MKYKKLDNSNVIKIELEKNEDERGFFARLFCKEEFTDQKLSSEFVQINNSFNEEKGTMRGLHYQLPPFSEDKLIRCIKGSILDIAIDLRPNSENFKKVFTESLTSTNRTMLYVPRGFAHGFMTLSDDTEIMYFSSNFYSPDHERGIRYDDKAFDLELPFLPNSISDKDNSWPDFNEKFHQFHKFKALINS